MLTCVVFPDPVSPTSTRPWLLFNVSINLSLYSQTGSVVRFLYNSQYFGENGNPTKYLPNMFFAVHSTHTMNKIQIKTRNKSNVYFESLQYRQDLFAITHYHKRKHFPSYTLCSENHNNTCTHKNRKFSIHGLKSDTLYWHHLAA